MYEKEIQRTAEYMQKLQTGESSGHDWWHTYRVWNLGRKIAIGENAELSVVEFTCLLHDIADFKLHGGDEEKGPRLAADWLYSLGVEKPVAEHVRSIISTTSFKGANAANKVKTLEAQCVQDADRLDAIGAIGIARCFAFGGMKGNIIYDPSIPANLQQSEEQYKKANSPQINHFYEKLLLIKDRLNTETAKKMSEEKHAFMQQFLNEFFKEWRESEA